MSSRPSYFIGDCKALDDYLKKRHGLFWGLVKYLNALFRGVGQVVFANNPWSGLIILASLYWASLLVGFATTVAATTAILTAIVFKQAEAKINAGLTTYCAVLVGSITSSLWEPTYGQPLTPLVWGFIVLAAALSVLVNAGLVNILGSFRPPLPSFTLAFNIVTILLFTVLQPMNLQPKARGNSDMAMHKQLDIGESKAPSIFQIPSFGTSRFKDPNGNIPVIDPLMVLEGIMLSMGQVYGVQNLKGSVAMYIGTILYSPTVCIMSIVGATVGSCFGLVFAGPTFETVYDGIWGFNPILAAIAVGAFFFVPTSLSFACAVADVALVVLIQQAMNLSFTPLRLPFLTFPFVISTMFFLEVTATGNILTRVIKFSYPEQHLREFIEKRYLKPPVSSDSEITHRKAQTVAPSAPILPSYYAPAPIYYSQDYSQSRDEGFSHESQTNQNQDFHSDVYQFPLNPQFHNQNAVTHTAQNYTHDHQNFKKRRSPHYPKLPVMSPTNTQTAPQHQEYFITKR